MESCIPYRLPTAIVLKDWGWAYPTYKFEVTKEIKSVEIDVSKLMADVFLENNLMQLE